MDLYKPALVAANVDSSTAAILERVQTANLGVIKTFKDGDAFVVLVNDLIDALEDGTAPLSERQEAEVRRLLRPLAAGPPERLHGTEAAGWSGVGAVGPAGRRTPERRPVGLYAGKKAAACRPAVLFGV